MSGVATDEGRPSRRPFRFRGVAIGAALAALAAPFLVHFAWQRGIPTIGDDSVAYLVLARFFAGKAGPLVAPWVAYHTNFPPLFPLVLAAAGGATDLLVAHLVVAAAAIGAVYAIQRYGALRLGSETAGVLLAAGFLLTPSAWIGIKGILSEPMYLLLSVVALDLHAARMEPRRDVAPGAWVAFGMLLAAAVLTRAAGVALVAAFTVHAAVRALRRADRPRWAPFLALVPVVLLVAAWIALRPAAGVDRYGAAASSGLADWLREPALMARLASHFFFGGWVSSFAADPEAPAAFRAAFAVLGIAGLAGAARAAAANRLDGWYVLATCAMVFLWVYPEENMRRLLYPVLPLLLMHAAELLVALAARIAPPPRARWIAACALAPAALLCLPAQVVVQQKSFDREPRDAAGRHAFADITDYYLTLNVQRAQALAGKQIAVLAGFDALAERTPPGARVMWMRPEYVAILGGRVGVPFYYGWDERRIAEEVRRTGTQYVVLSREYKADLSGRPGDPFATLAGVEKYADPLYAMRNPAVGGDEFVLMKVDPGRLAGFLARDRNS
ncbi:MAG TPA: hypothetical protein VLY46_10570 [Usitatibacter sp.]|nr:hypothetical protein [Usitatibacter sp.]